MFLFLGSWAWSSWHTEDILHLPASTLPPSFSFLCPQWIFLDGCRLQEAHRESAPHEEQIWYEKRVTLVGTQAMPLSMPPHCSFTECPMSGAAWEPVRCSSSVHTHFTMGSPHLEYIWQYVNGNGGDSTEVSLLSVAQKPSHCAWA